MACFADMYGIGQSGQYGTFHYSLVKSEIKKATGIMIWYDISWSNKYA